MRNSPNKLGAQLTLLCRPDARRRMLQRLHHSKTLIARRRSLPNKRRPGTLDTQPAKLRRSEGAAADGLAAVPAFRSSFP